MNIGNNRRWNYAKFDTETNNPKIQVSLFHTWSQQDMKNRKVTTHSMAYISFLKLARKLGGRGWGSP